MKTLKKIFAGMFTVALFATLFAVPAYAQSGSYVFDEQNVLSSSQFQTLEQKGADYASEYGIGVYWVFTDTMDGNMNPTSSERNNYARQFYQSHSLGVGSGKNGIIAVVAVKSRDYTTVKHFDNSGEDPFSDECAKALEEEYKSYLSDNDWYGGAKAYYDLAGEQMAYFKATGKQWTEPDPISLLIKVLAALGIPAAVAASSVRRDKEAMATAHEKHEASDYIDQSSLRLSVADDRFITTTVSVVPLPDDDDDRGGGGGWSDMGGGFSGTGGGKF